MNLELLSPAALGAALAALAAGVLGLHLLRVRLRRVTVDSLLFFRMVGEVQRPRVLGGRPARWASLLLLLLAVAALALAAARPVDRGGDGPSQVLVVDWTRADDALVERATALAEHGLGPDGRVLAFAERCWTVLDAGEPPHLLDARLDATEAGGSAAHLWNALEVARTGLDAADRIVVLGGPEELPSELAGIPLVRELPFADAPARPRICRVMLDPRDGLHEVVDVATGGAALEVRLLVDGEVAATQRVASEPRGATRVRLGPLPETACTVRIELGDEPAGGLDALERTEVDRSPIPVLVADGLPTAITRAITADPRLTVADPDDARAALAVAATAHPELPTLVLVTGTEPDLDRQPRSTRDCPLPLSLRDRQTRAPAFTASDDEHVWIEDCAQGAALLTARNEDTAPRSIRLAAWLLDDDAHRDVPVLVSGSLRWLAGVLESKPSTPRFSAAPVEPTDESGLATADADAPSFDDPTDLGLALLALALALLAADTWWFGRGRMP